jgi:hypothetical protein
VVKRLWFYLAHLCFRWGYTLANRAKDGVGEADEFRDDKTQASCADRFVGVEHYRGTPYSPDELKPGGTD